jgi:two-component sensor histidine kinase
MGATQILMRIKDGQAGIVNKVNRWPVYRGSQTPSVMMRDDRLNGNGGEGVSGRSFSAVVGRAAMIDKAAFSAEADHRIANHLALLAGYVRLKSTDLARQSAEPSRDSVQLLLQGVGAQINAIARLHRSLAVAPQQANVDLGEHLHGVCTSFVSGVSEAVELIEDFSAGCAVRSDQILPLTQIVAEVVTNALKHAHADGDAGVILVRCGKDDGGAVLIEVIDDGAGLPETFDPTTGGGLGFRLLRAHARQLGARIAFESASRGLRFRLILPPMPA